MDRGSGARNIPRHVSALEAAHLAAVFPLDAAARLVHLAAVSPLDAAARLVLDVFVVGPMGRKRTRHATARVPAVTRRHEQGGTLKGGRVGVRGVRDEPAERCEK